MESRLKPGFAGLFQIQYEDGLKVNLLNAPGLVAEWAAAWRYADGSVDATAFALQEYRPYYHFGVLVDYTSEMMNTGNL